MFQHLPSPCYQNTQNRSQTTPFRPYYNNMPSSHHINHWLRMDCLPCQPSLLDFSRVPLTQCKIEQPQPVENNLGQNNKVEKVKNELYHTKETKEEFQSKTQEEESRVAIQKRVISLSWKINKTALQKEEIKQYRLMRKDGYLSKKAKRTFQKKIVYSTRKRVADRRIRFKGKFINEFQARQLLGLTGQEFGFQELKKMMNELKSRS